ncbi:ECF transporter S component [Virgibacillus ndiopensis]|uniref:ECF transporter S component n=1 Tax=Virgibacillus ndiopensis TaxID=2004408 RepID=UPI000C0728DA|nr:ECF transporter S component [Virgibacillus ndiopensis]
MRYIHTRSIVFTSLCIAIGLLLPQIVKMIPMAYPGSVLLPMHIPVLICGFLCGWRLGGLCGMTLPLLASILTGMPPIFPIGIAMIFELGTYGALTGILYHYTNGKILISILGAMLGGRIVLGIVNIFLFNLANNPYGLAVFFTSAFVTALPGIIIQLILVPASIQALEKSRLIAK